MTTVVPLAQLVLHDAPICYGILKRGNHVSEGIPQIEVRDYRHGMIDTSDLVRAHPDIDKQYERSRLKSGDVLLSIRGTTGLVALVPPELDGANISRDSARIRIAPPDNRFVYHVLQSLPVQREIREKTIGQAVKGINLAAVRGLSIPWLPEQVRRLGTRILDDCDAARRLLEECIIAKRIFKNGLMQQLLTGRKRFPQHHESPWERVNLGNICTLVNGHVFRQEDWMTEGLPIIRIANLNGSRDFDYFSGEPDPAWTIHTGDLLFAWSGTRGTSFGPAIWHGGTAVLNQHIFKVTPRAGVDKLWFYQMLRFLTVQIERRAHGGSGIVHVRKSDLARYEVLLPALAEQQCIAHVLHLAESEVDQLIHLRELFDRQKSALLSRLHSGEILVSPT